MPKRGRPPKGTYTTIGIRYWLGGKVLGPIKIRPRTDILYLAQSGDGGAKNNLAKLLTEELSHKGYNGPDLKGDDLHEDSLCNYV